MEAAKLLIVARLPAELKILCDALDPEDYSTACFTSAEAALPIIGEQEFDLLLTDLLLPQMDGIAFLRAAHVKDPDLVGVVMTRYGTIDSAVEAMKAGAIDYLVKPFKKNVILRVLARALHIQKLRIENIHLHEEVGSYERSMAIGSAHGVDAVLQKVADAAMGQIYVRDVSVLVPAEDGKTLSVVVARGERAKPVGKSIAFSSELCHWVERSLQGPVEPYEFAETPIRLAGAPGDVLIPMLVGGKFIGILDLTLEKSRRQAAPLQLKALIILASAAASAIEASSLLEKLRSAENRYRGLAEGAADMIFRYELSPKPRFTYVNLAATSLNGYSPDEHYADPDLILKTVHSDDRRLMETLMRGEPSAGPASLRCLHKNGHTVWVEQHTRLLKDIDGRVIAIEGIVRDITARRDLEEQLRQSQKMEALGLLAGGVAHDFNNLLTVILGYSELILADDSPTDQAVERIAQVKKAAEQAACLTQQLLAFGRRQIVQPTILDINKVVDSSLKMLRRMVRADIQLVTILDPTLGPVRADPHQLEQILMNLAVNASAAMPQGGKITIETRNVVMDKPAAGWTLDSDGGYVKLMVSDTGCGMDASTRARIFEPFFTTKGPGRGTGLGLSIVYGIVKQSAGLIRVFSEPGEGTRFEILLPRTQDVEESPAVMAKPSEAPVGCETILVVEDHPEVRQLIGIMLRIGGYEGLMARDATEALQIFKEHEGNIGLVLVDVIMPGMSGAALVESLRNFNRAIKVLYMSGYTGDNTASYGELDPGVPFIQKPFSAVDLIVRIREVLDSGTVATHAA
jgi:PAS domain S-box-containing protein